MTRCDVQADSTEGVIYQTNRSSRLKPMTHNQQESPDIVGRRYRPTKIGRLSLKFRLLFSADHRLAKNMGKHA